MRKLAAIVLAGSVMITLGQAKVTLPDVAAGATVGISVLEAPDTWRKFKRAVKKARHPKRKEVTK